jgi:glycosyltransferase involved in cell wall biosynthesis
MLCGTPVVGFRIGGIAEMIMDGLTGYFAEKISPESLAGAIIKYQQNPNHFEAQQIAGHARSRYDITICVEKYLSLYRSLNEQPKAGHWVNQPVP